MNVIVFVVLFISCVQAFQISHLKLKHSSFAAIRRVTHIGAADDEPIQAYKAVELVPMDKVTIKNSAAVTGGVLGLILGGPVIGLIIAAITNYVAKKNDEVGDVARGVGKTVIESYNFLNKVNAKYEITSKVGDAVGKAIDSVDSESDVFEKVKTSLTTTTEKLGDLNEQYDIVGKCKEIAVTSATLSDAAIDKLLELNAKYDFFGSTKTVANSALEKVREQTNKA